MNLADSLLHCQTASVIKKMKVIMSVTATHKTQNSTAKILFASLIGTGIEFFDFYIYANAAVLVFPALFFPEGNPQAALMQSFATFAVAFFARPLGSAVFGHFGDRVGRKVTLVLALMTMGLSTVLIGLLPSYATIGIWAPMLLVLCRFGQGLGLGGEWGGAVLLATENAPPNRRAWYGMFPQLGAPIGFILSGGIFLLLSEQLTDAQFMSYGWRIPFILSSLLVILGLYIRLNIHETPDYLKYRQQHQPVKVPVWHTLRFHFSELCIGTLLALSAFVLFYLMTVFTLSWATSQMGFSRAEFLRFELWSALALGIFIPISGWLTDKFGAFLIQLLALLWILLMGWGFGGLFASAQALQVLLFLCLGMAAMGMTYGPLSTMLASLFPTQVRYTGCSVSFNMAGILGASFAPFVATWLASSYSVAAVGWYLSGASIISMLALLWMRSNQRKQLAD